MATAKVNVRQSSSKSKKPGVFLMEEQRESTYLEYIDRVYAYQEAERYETSKYINIRYQFY